MMPYPYDQPSNGGVPPNNGCVVVGVGSVVISHGTITAEQTMTMIAIPASVISVIAANVPALPQFDDTCDHKRYRPTGREGLYKCLNSSCRKKFRL